MKKLLLLILPAIAFFACKKINLDGLGFPATKTDMYLFDGYADGDMNLPDSFTVDANNRTLVTMESIDAATGQSYTIYGVYLGDTSTISTDTVILYLHGQSVHLDLYWDRATLLANLGNKYNYGVFMIDYRGYGMSEGEPTEQGLYEDCQAAIDWLTNRGLTGDRAIYYGFSLGAIPAIDRAAYGSITPSKLIVEAPLASVENLVHSSTLINLDPGFVTTLEFPNAEKIKDVSAPFMWFHGTDDDYIEIENGELIYANHPGVKTPVRVQNAMHGNIPDVMGIFNYMSTLETFIQN